jgi:hypothetical protein
MISPVSAAVGGRAGAPGHPRGPCGASFYLARTASLAGACNLDSHDSASALHGSEGQQEKVHVSTLRMRIPPQRDSRARRARKVLACTNPESPLRTRTFQVMSIAARARSVTAEAVRPHEIHPHGGNHRIPDADAVSAPVISAPPSGVIIQRGIANVRNYQFEAFRHYRPGARQHRPGKETDGCIRPCETRITLRSRDEHRDECPSGLE